MTPLATTLRPKTLNEIIGQNHILTTLQKMVNKQHIPSIILWGPPGTGKTTIAHAIANDMNIQLITLNATETNTKEIKTTLQTNPTILFIDEISRLTKTVKDIFLPIIETGTTTIIGATTENPKYTINSAILSRCLTYETKPLNDKNMLQLILKIKNYYKTQNINITINKNATTKLIARCSGDARKLTTVLEHAINIEPNITEEIIDDIIPTKHTTFDKTGTEHYNFAHCYQTAIQNSDTNGAIYWLAAWLHSGEDPAYICRRMLITAFEDCSGNPTAITTATAACYTTEKTGMPECMIPMAQATIEMATSKRNKTAYNAIKQAMHDIQTNTTQHTPPHHTQPYTPITKNYIKQITN